jgi:hypothetical protein
VKPPVGHVAVHAPFLETEDGAVGRRAIEDAHVAGFVEMRDAALLVQPGVQLLGGGQLDELARHDENQFAARFQVAHAFSMKNRKRLLRVEQVGMEMLFSFPGNILITHVRRVADDGVELLVERVGEEIADLRPGGATPRSISMPTTSAPRWRSVSKKAPSPADGSSTRPLLRHRSSMKATTLGGVKTWPSCATSRPIS